MQTEVQPNQIMNDVSSGIIQSVKWSITPPNSVAHAVNFVFDENFGEATVRKGSTLTGSQITGTSAPINGMHFFSAASKTLAVVPNAGNTAQGIYYYNGTSWTTSDLATDTANLKTRFASMMGVCIRLNGTDSPLASTTGATWAASTTLDTTNMPNGKFVKVYKSQMVIAGKSSKPDSLFISSVPNAAGTSISWTSGNREIVINPDDDAGNITALGSVNGLLIILKNRAMYTWNNHSTQADEVISIGCSSQESVQNFGNGLLAFFNDKGVWATTGEQPVLLSRRIQKWIDGMDSSFYSQVSAYGDGEHLFVSLGSCTVDSTAYSNVVARYTVNTKEWSVFSYANKFYAFSKYISSGAVQILAGDTTGRVLQIDSTSTTDNGTDIGYQIQSQRQVYGSSGILKTISDHIVVYGENGQSPILQVQEDLGDWKTVGVAKDIVSHVPLDEELKGNYLSFRIVGTSNATRYRFQGIETPHVTLVDYVS